MDDTEMIATVKRLIERIEGRAAYLESHHGTASIHVQKEDLDGMRAVLARLEGRAAAVPVDLLERAREICEPLLYQRPCTGDDIENPGLLLWRRDYDKLCERIAAALAAERAEGLAAPGGRMRAMTAKVLRLYQSDKGIWRYEIARDGRVTWSSLHTRDECIARAAYERIVATYARPKPPVTP